ncbi:MAG: DUF1854 domain-containing protein [Zwartia sp.]|jgi:hypothetical protein
MSDFLLARNQAGRLLLTLTDGRVYEGVVPVRAFPLQAPEQCVAFMSLEGKEVAWVDELSALPQDTRDLIKQEIASREMMPVIERIVSVSTLSTPSTWEVVTDRGATQLILKGEEDIRRLTGSTLIITDSHGLRFMLPDMQALDKNSRRILDRFL